MSRRVIRGIDGRSFEEPSVNLTPLIDVVFVILIAFIVVAPLLELDRIELAESGVDFQDKMHSVQETSPIAIYVREDNAISVNGKFIPIPQLASHLKQIKKQYPNANPQLFHDRKAHFGTYQSVKNAAEAAGFNKLDIILKPA